MGYGGGPAARNPLVHDACKLRLRGLTDGAPVRPGLRLSGRMSWSRYGEQTAAVAYTLHTHADGGSLGLVYDITVRATGERIAKNYIVPLLTTKQPAGGVRFWFWCERGRAMASVLYLMPGSSVFASRAAFGRVSYRSQRISDRDRLLEKAQRIRMDLGGSPAVFDAFPERPPGMHRSRYERLRAKGEAAGGASLAMLGQQLERSGYRDRVLRGRV